MRARAVPPAGQATGAPAAAPAAAPAHTPTGARRVLAPDARSTAAERVLLDLAAEHVDSFMIVSTAEQKLAHRLLQVVDEPSASLAVARALRQVAGITGLLGRRTQDLLAAVETLRLQRRLHAGGRRDDD